MSNLTHSNGHGTGYGNQTLLDNPRLCTLETCDLSMASFLYIPTLPGNAIFAAIFGIYLVAQIFLGIKHKTWGYMVAMVMGLVLEVIGYIGRILLHNDPFNDDNFLMYLVTLTIAPALLSASVSLPILSVVYLANKILLDLPLSRTHRQRVRREPLTLQASHIYTLLRLLRHHLPRSSSSWWWHRQYSR